MIIDIDDDDENNNWWWCLNMMGIRIIAVKNNDLWIKDDRMWKLWGHIRKNDDLNGAIKQKDIYGNENWWWGKK